MVCDCSLSEGCSENCINRMMFVECDPKYCPCGDECKNCRFQKREYAEVTLMEPKDAKGFGLMTRQALKKGQFVIEYVGEVVNEEEHNRRKVEYRKEGKRHFYFMSIANGEVIDATRRGNLSRFLNHSCNPNCETQKWQVGGELCIGIFALRDVDANTELTFDYHFERDAQQTQRLRCLCGEPNCRGFVGSKTANVEDARVCLGDDPSSSASLYDPARDEPRPVMVERGHVEDDPLGSLSTSSQQQGGRRRRFSGQVARGQTEVEQFLETVCSEGGVLTSDAHVIAVVRYLKPQYSIFEISNIFQVILASPTRSMREEFVKRGILSALQVLMHRYTEELTKANLPLLRKALDVVSFLPLTEEAIIRSRTGKCSFTTFLLDLCRHHDQEAARRAGAIAEKHLASQLRRRRESQQRAQQQMASSSGWRDRERERERDRDRDRPRIREWRQDGGRPPSLVVNANGKRPRDDARAFLPSPPPRPAHKTAAPPAAAVVVVNANGKRPRDDARAFLPSPPPRPAHKTAAPPAAAPPPPRPAPTPTSTSNAKRFKEISDAFVWKQSSDDFRAIVREIIEYRVKKSTRDNKVLRKDKAKVEAIIDKLYNKVMKKENERAGGAVTVHKDLVKKVDGYARGHMKQYSK